MKRTLSGMLCLLLVAPAAAVPLDPAPLVELTAPDASALRRPTRRPGPLRIGVPLTVNLQPFSQGEWRAEGDEAVWRIAVTAEGARHLSATLHDVVLPDGAALSGFDAAVRQRRGPYRAADVRNGKLALPMVAGDTLVLEARLPAAQREGLAFRVARINYGFRGLKGEGAHPKFSRAGSCNVDVACPAGGGWEDPIRSVANYTIEHPDGEFTCTGTLVNNTAQDGTPLLLSADHCFRSDTGGDAGDPDTVRIYWNHQAQVCDTDAGPDALSQNQTGATILARSEGLFGGSGSDMLLLLLADLPAAAFNVHYAGWDNRDIAPAGVTGIHHPQGDQKAISVEHGATAVTTYSSNVADAAAKFLRVADWDVGVTETGSSGSGLWSNQDGLLVATLAGGIAACNDPGAGDNGQPDWYGRMHSHFFAFPDSTRSVKTFLDPENTGAQTLAGTDNPSAGPPDYGGGGGGGGGGSYGGGGGFGWLGLLPLLAAASRRRRPVLIGLAAVMLAACQTAPAMDQPIPGKVTDLPTFAAFIEHRPDPDAFRRRYPDVRLVLPGEAHSKELRRDNSRYFAQLDGEGRITGGSFR